MTKPLNSYDWRSQPDVSEVEHNELYRALNKLQSETLQWIHLILHDKEGGGYISEDMPRETLHDAIAFILDNRDGTYHNPTIPRPWYNKMKEAYRYQMPWNTREDETVPGTYNDSPW